ncbi:hypothetical protein [Roseimicrobium sp. ORNL1]|uniref:hypothetical protein n=1 Tax=Roseimicrobium sp. ORNL1 TaxID=2711231 RepID=UPI0013E1F924|nr:hypothetical protein [Roseimicrobium sp. ORNL1]QIF02552.1 hypothetical protein G5S37_13810 [Roseimicrobium sp. ORNL1]
MIFLTDGGGEDRVEQTRQGLSRIGLLDRAVFLNHAEKEFYDRLLQRDVAYFQGVADQVREILKEKGPACVCSDAMEFYNPVHDLAIPITRSALMGLEGWTHYEVPLVHQVPATEAGAAATETYLVQRLPEALEDEAKVHALNEAELEAKVAARDGVYTILAEQFGTALTDLSRDHLGHEVLGTTPASGMREPGAAYVLRYEWRANLLLEEGAIREAITLDGHFRPVAEGLLSRAA